MTLKKINDLKTMFYHHDVRSQRVAARKYECCRSYISYTFKTKTSIRIYKIKRFQCELKQKKNEFGYAVIDCIENFKENRAS